ncbi:hypothetical protein [Blastopirellula marina]|uniref:Polymerase nucleotidyl transferase domain-containing protein n=1 Tax=Blastopirellula marina DSM 3645 TaxID=314230 RepID=A3ZV84_9BACT|nr:hypothetical protein [Blastopirellula marina]EAQ79230.1 hypothetical protein DSM3645_02103 [Blastopirellula marina DSM 3645]
MQLRDKDYLRTNDGLIFNVLGYDHAVHAATCGLKYVDSVKWLDTYDQALRFLGKRYPHYVDELIRVPFDRVAEVYRSEDRLPQLRQAKPVGLLQKSLDFANLLASTLRWPLEACGLTDSLLWGCGGEDSDIDLVIYGEARCRTWLDQAERVFASPEIKPIAPQFIQRPPHLDDEQFATYCRRKRNQGYYRGTRFSVRGVRAWNEFPQPLPLVAGTATERELTIADNRQSMFFPVIYETAENVSIVSFPIGYEATFAPGDRVRVQGAQVDAQTILVGSRYGSAEMIRLISSA